MENYSFTRTNANIKITNTNFSKILEIKENGNYNLKLEFIRHNETELLMINNLYENKESQFEIQEIGDVQLLIVKPKNWKIDIEVSPNNCDFNITFNNKSYLEYKNGEFIFYFDGI